MTTTADITPSLQIKQVDTYMTGENFYRTHVEIHNSNTDTSATGLVLYHGGDCFLGNSDAGYGAHDAGTGAIACTKTPNNDPVSATLSLIPDTAGSNFFEGLYSANWSAIAAGTALPDSCDCTIAEDNGASLSWTLDPIPAGGTVSVEFHTAVIPAGPIATTDPGTVTSDTSASLAGRVAPNGRPTTYRFEYGPTTGYGSRTPDTATSGTGYFEEQVVAGIGGLIPGTEYHYRVVATNDLGSAAGVDQTFTTTGTAPAITTPVVTPTPLGAPVQGQTANVTPEKGEVFVKLPGAAKSSVPRFKGAPKGFIPLTQARQVPIGSILDTTSGQVGLTVAASKTTTQQASFSQGRFGFAQSKSGSPLTTLTMQGGNLTQCGTKVPSGGAKKVSAAARRGRSLFGSGHGRFRTRGRNSSATVRGTEWLTKDTCAGTLTVVRRGTVVVRDFTKRKNVVVKKGHRYFARAPKKR